VVGCHAPHVFIDYPDHKDHDPGRGEQKGVERIAGTRIVVASTSGAAIFVPMAAVDMAANVAGSHDASAVCRPWVGMLQCCNGRVGGCVCDVSC
jgi:hypothetical protein